MELANLASRYADADLVLHVIGGVAVLTWTEICRTTRAMTTYDFDTVIPASCCGTAEDAERHGRQLADIRAQCGFTESRDGRLKGCSFAKTDSSFLVEFIVGSRAVGKVTEPPRQRISRKSGLYASRNDWLDFVEDHWADIRGECGTHRFCYRIPDLAGMTVLKIRAVADKLTRRQKTQGAARDHESRQLGKHADDLLLLRRMLDERGERPRLTQIAETYPAIRTEARRVSLLFNAERSTFTETYLASLLVGARPAIMTALEV